MPRNETFSTNKTHLKVSFLFHLLRMFHLLSRAYFICCVPFVGLQTLLSSYVGISIRQTKETHSFMLNLKSKCQDDSKMSQFFIGWIFYPNSLHQWRWFRYFKICYKTFFQQIESTKTRDNHRKLLGKTHRIKVFYKFTISKAINIIP